MIQPSNASFDSDTLIKWVHEHELELVWWGCASQVISPYLRIFCLGCLFVALRGVLMIREEQIPLKDELHQQKTSIHNMASVCMRLKKLNSALSALSVKASPNWCKLMIECTHEGDAYKRFCYKYWGQFGRENREIATSVSWRLLLRAPPSPLLALSDSNLQWHSLERGVLTKASQLHNILLVLSTCNRGTVLIAHSKVGKNPNTLQRFLLLFKPLILMHLNARGRRIILTESVQS